MTKENYENVYREWLLTLKGKYYRRCSVNTIECNNQIVFFLKYSFRLRAKCKES